MPRKPKTYTLDPQKTTMNNIILESISIRNFKSFGDYDTVVNLRHRGPTLITGSVENDDNKSNGSGKSSVMEAIIWCLFGRLSDIHNPGDKVINWNIGKNCVVKLMMQDGYEIIRTRKHQNHSDLLILKDGNTVEDGDSTNTNAQKTLERIFDLDFETFVSSIYFGQFSGSFIGLSDVKKKRVIEKLFGLSKLKYYAEVSKHRLGKIESEIESHSSNLASIDAEMQGNNHKIGELENKSKDFEEARRRKINQLEDKINALQSESAESIDIEEIEKFWSTIDLIKSKISELNKLLSTHEEDRSELYSELISLKDQQNILKQDVYKIKVELENIARDIKIIEEMEGICPTCGQQISEELVQTTIEDYKNKHADVISAKNDAVLKLKEDLHKIEQEILNKTQKMKDTDESINKISGLIHQSEEAIRRKTSNKKTITEAKSHNESIQHINNRIDDVSKNIDDARSEKNPYDEHITFLKAEIDKLNNKRKDVQSKIDDLNKSYSHTKFIYRAYSEKRQIRSFVIAGYVPVLNDKLSYYLHAMNISEDMKFNELLQIKSDSWDYSTHSGGEKKRVDLAMMCALHDTFITMNGSKINIMALDEIDKELDKEGVNDYVRLIMDDLSGRVESIFVISHKNEINHAFPSQIKLNKEDGFSHVYEE